MEEQKIIGLDLSLTCTGYCLLDANNFTTGRIKTKLKDIDRLIYIVDNIREIIYAPPTHHTLAVIEGYSYASNSNTAYQIGELGGAIRVLLFQNNIDFIIIAPKSLKKFATGNGNAKKNDMLNAFMNKHGHIKDHNEVDAYFLAKFGEEYLNKFRRKTNDLGTD